MNDVFNINLDELDIARDSDCLQNLLAGRTDGVHDIAGTYHEEYHQDYWGEWDADFWIENERMRYLAAPPSAVPPKEK